MNLDREALLSRADSYESWLSVCAFFVVVGVSLECWEAWHHKDEKPARKSLTKWSKAVRFLFTAAPALVAGGVFGEWFLGLTLVGVHEQIRQIDDKIVADARGLAANARKDLIVAKTELLKIEKSLKPRHLESNPRYFFIEELKTGKKGSVNIWFFPEDVEAHWFAFDISDALKSAGWRVGEATVIPHNAMGSIYREMSGPSQEQIRSYFPLLMRIGANSNRSGLTIISNKHPDKLSGKDAQGTLFRAFAKAGLVAGPGQFTEPSWPDNTFLVVISPKP